MINRNKKYFDEQKLRSNNAHQKNMVKKSNDNKIDEDFPGFPHGHAKENIINPTTEKEKKVADLHNQDGEKINRNGLEEQRSDGSANAFNATEQVKE